MNTEMELSNRDIMRIERLGYDPKEFVMIRGGIPYLRNVNGYCYFYDRASRRCRIYRYRPLGCRIYPVIYVYGEGVSVDRLCPMHGTVSKDELRRKASILLKLIKEIDKERAIRLHSCSVS